jgi:hypothetical protein
VFFALAVAIPCCRSESFAFHFDMTPSPIKKMSEFHAKLPGRWVFFDSCEILT